MLGADAAQSDFFRTQQVHAIAVEGIFLRPAVPEETTCLCRGNGSSRRWLSSVPLRPPPKSVAESGVAGYEAIKLLGLIGPAGFPAQLSAAMRKVLVDPKVIEKFVGLDTEARFTAPQAFFEIMRTQAETWIPVIRAAKLKLE